MLLVFLLLILLFSLTLLVMYVAGLPEDEQGRFRSNPFLRLFLSAAKAAPETESTPRSALADHAETAHQQTGEPIDAEAWSDRQILGVALTGASMAAPGSVLGLLIGFDFLLGLLFPLLPLWIAAAGAIAFRAAKLSWRQTVLAAVLAGAALLLFGGVLGLWVSGGVFLLPMFDPSVRRAAPAPSTWKVAVTALALAAPFLLVLAGAGKSSNFGEALFFGFLILGIPLILSGILLVLGCVFALFKPDAPAGSWLGGVGIFLASFMLVGVVVLLALQPG